MTQNWFLFGSTKIELMYLEGKERAKIGKVTLDINGDRYRLGFVNNKTHPRPFLYTGWEK